MILTLKGKSHKGKNRIRELGDKWQAILDSKFKGQPAFLAKSIQEIESGKATHLCNDRWIHKDNDSDMVIVSIET